VLEYKPTLTSVVTRKGGTLPKRVLTTSSVLQGVVGVQHVWYACPRIVKLSTPLLGLRVVVFPGPSDRLDTSMHLSLLAYKVHYLLHALKSSVALAETLWASRTTWTAGGVVFACSE
jgi:hypothetical protein